MVFCGLWSQAIFSNVSIYLKSHLRLLKPLYLRVCGLFYLPLYNWFPMCTLAYFMCLVRTPTHWLFAEDSYASLFGEVEHIEVSGNQPRGKRRYPDRSDSMYKWDDTFTHSRCCLPQFQEFGFVFPQTFFAKCVACFCIILNWNFLFLL